MHCDFWQRCLFQTCQSFCIRSALKVGRVYRGVSFKSLTSSVFQRNIGSPTCSTPSGQDLPSGRRLYLYYTAQRRDVLGCTLVQLRRSRDFPRPKRCPEGHLKAQGKSRGPNLIDTDSRQCTANHSSLIHPLGCIRKCIPIPHPIFAK